MARAKPDEYTFNVRTSLSLSVHSRIIHQAGGRKGMEIGPAVNVNLNKQFNLLFRHNSEVEERVEHHT